MPHYISMGAIFRFFFIKTKLTKKRNCPRGAIAPVVSAPGETEVDLPAFYDVMAGCEMTRFLWRHWQCCANGGGFCDVTGHWPCCAVTCVNYQWSAAVLQGSTVSVLFCFSAHGGATSLFFRRSVMILPWSVMIVVRCWLLPAAHTMVRILCCLITNHGKYFSRESFMFMANDWIKI